MTIGARTWVALTAAAILLTMKDGAAIAQPAGDQIAGTVVSVDGRLVTLIDGTSFTVPETARVTLVAKGTPADLVPGQFIAITAQRGSDGVLQASIVSSFPEELRGTGEGQRPMDGANLMTNATIREAVLDAVDGGNLSVTFLNEADSVRVSSATLIEIRWLGSWADVVPGVTISAVVTDGVSGNVSIR